MDESLNEVFIPSTWRRLIARAIDEIVVLLLFFPMWDFWYEMMDTEDEVFVPLYLFFFLLLFPMVYEFAFLSFFRQTPGKWVMDLWVVPQSDAQKKLLSMQAFLRSLAGRFSLFLSWAPYVVALFKYDRTHMPDWFAETRVVQLKRRKHPAKGRWLVATMALVICSYHGFNEAIYMWDSVDLDSGRVDLQEAMGSPLGDYEFVFPGDDGDD